MKVAEIKRKYKNKWVLAEVLKADQLNRVLEARPILASKDRDDVYDALGKQPVGKMYTSIYTGKIRGAFILNRLAL